MREEERKRTIRKTLFPNVLSFYSLPVICIYIINWPLVMREWSKIMIQFLSAGNS